MTFIGEVRAMPYNFVPSIETQWLTCDGTEYQVRQFQALYTIIGNLFGGTGGTTFRVPDLRDRIAVGAGTSPVSGGARRSGDKWGEETVTLSVVQMPPHTHQLHLPFTGAVADLSDTPSSAYGVSRTFNQWNYAAGSGNALLNELTVAPEGGTTSGGVKPHDNCQPVLAIPYFICWMGRYPEKP